MLGLTHLPPWFEQAFEQFESIFSDRRNIASFNSFTSAVIMSHSKWTVNGLYQGISRPDAKSPRTYRYSYENPAAKIIHVSNKNIRVSDSSPVQYG